MLVGVGRVVGVAPVVIVMIVVIAVEAEGGVGGVEVLLVILLGVAVGMTIMIGERKNALQFNNDQVTVYHFSFVWCY